MRVLAIVSALAAITLTGCASSSATKVAVNYATMRYIDEAGPTANIQRAARVAAVARQALAAVEGEGFELGTLTQEIIRNLPGDLLPSDRALAISLIGLIGEEINARLDAGKLTPESRLKVKKVLDWIIEATSYYES